MFAKLRVSPGRCRPIPPIHSPEWCAWRWHWSPSPAWSAPLPLPRHLPRARYGRRSWTRRRSRVRRPRSPSRGPGPPAPPQFVSCFAGVGLRRSSPRGTPETRRIRPTTGARSTARSRPPSLPGSIPSCASRTRRCGRATSPTGGTGTTWPKPGELADFATAAARRYANSPVRTWQVWNEPNARSHLNPQYRDGRPVTPRHYRSMVNAFAKAVHTVNPDYVVVAGALAPFGHFARDIQVVAPLNFMRAMLCVSRGGASTCSARAQFDVWAQNPYTNGGPERQAAARDDVSIGDLPEVRRVLAQASRARHVTARAPVELWVTEFAWDTRPPDPHGVAASLHARWVAEALYAMWRNGVTLVTWWRLRDDPLTTPYQSGLYARRGNKPRSRPRQAVARSVPLPVRRQTDTTRRARVGPPPTGVHRPRGDRAPRRANVETGRPNRCRPLRRLSRDAPDTCRRLAPGAASGRRLVSAVLARAPAVDTGLPVRLRRFDQLPPLRGPIETGKISPCCPPRSRTSSRS